jgi:hypothetical protein
MERCLVAHSKKQDCASSIIADCRLQQVLVVGFSLFLESLPLQFWRGGN